MEGLILRKVQILDSPFQGSPLLVVLIHIGKNLLNITEEKGKRERPAFRKIFLLNVPGDIPLELCQIPGAPCTEHGILSAPGKKIGKDLRK